MNRARADSKHEPREREGKTMAEPSYRGARVRELARPNKQYSRGRVCAAEGCQTALSMYNKWQFCWQHEPVHSYVSRGKRKSSKAA
jgi:hypothetical protein